MIVYTLSYLLPVSEARFYNILNLLAHIVNRYIVIIYKSVPAEEN